MERADLRIAEQIPWLPDETVFSWCSRYHLLAANGLASATCMQLFGRRRLGLAHDFPTGLQALAQRAGGSLGATEDIIKDRTVLAFYAPFRPAEMFERATRKMSSDGIGSLKYELGLLTSGLGAAHPLKACPSCLANDHQHFRVAHWRRNHQLPGVWICPDHGDALLLSTLKLDQKARFQWVLPAQADLQPWTAHDERRDLRTSRVVAKKVAALSVALCALSSGRLADAERIAKAFLRGLDSRGWLGTTTRVRWAAMKPALRRTFGSLSVDGQMFLAVWTPGLVMAAACHVKFIKLSFNAATMSTPASMGKRHDRRHATKTRWTAEYFRRRYGCPSRSVCPHVH